MRQIGPPAQKMSDGQLYWFRRAKKTYPIVRRDGTLPQKVSHRYGSDKYQNPAQVGFVLSRLAPQFFHGAPRDKLSVRIVSLPSREQPRRGSIGFPHRTRRHILLRTVPYPEPKERPLW